MDKDRPDITGYQIFVLLKTLRKGAYSHIILVYCAFSSLEKDMNQALIINTGNSEATQRKNIKRLVAGKVVFIK